MSLSKEEKDWGMSSRELHSSEGLWVVLSAPEHLSSFFTVLSPGSFWGVVALPCIQGKLQEWGQNLCSAQAVCYTGKVTIGRDVAQLSKYLPSIREAPGSVSSTTDTGFGGK